MEIFKPLHPVRLKRLKWYIKSLKPVAYYPLWEQTGSTARNHAPANINSLNGTITGATLNQPGQVGRAYSFDGVNDLITLPQGGSIPFYDNAVFSISALVYKDALTGEENIFGEGSTSDNDPQYSVSMWNLGGNNKVRVFIRDDVANVLVGGNSSNTIVSLTAFNNIVWIDNNGTCKLYINGVEDTASVNGDFDYTRGTLTINKTVIGALMRASGSQYWGGDIQHFAFFNKALTSTEILKLARVSGLG